MNAREKIVAAVEDLKARGAKRPDPPLFRLLWRLGIHLPPPHYLGFLSLTVLFGVPFALGLALALGASGLFVVPQLSAAKLGLTSALAGLAFGLAMAAVQRSEARGLRLPRWSEFGTDPGPEDDPW